MNAPTAWLWASAAAAVALRTNNPLLLGIELMIILYVGTARHPGGSDGALPPAMATLLAFSMAVVLARMIVLVLLPPTAGGASLGGLGVIEPIEGFRIGGTVSTHAVIYALYDSLRLVCVAAAFGAALSMTSPAQMLRRFPAAVYELGVALAVALSVAPAVATSIRGRAAIQRARGRSRRQRVVGTVGPVLDETLDRALSVAATLDARGYGGQRSPMGAGRMVALWLALAATGYGVYALGAQVGGRRWLGLVALAGGALGSVWALGRTGSSRTRHRLGVLTARRDPDRRDPFDAVVVLGALAALATSVIATRNSPNLLLISDRLGELPTLPLLAALGLIGLALAAIHRPPRPGPELAAHSVGSNASAAVRWRP